MKKTLRFEIKEVSTEGTFEGILSTYGNVDDGGDIVEPTAYRKTLKDQGLTRPMLWQHKSDQPCGLLTLEDRPDATPPGLWCKGKILLDIPTGQTAYALIKAGIVKGLSIGFESIKDSVKNGVRHLHEIKLYEGSIVTFPMQSLAVITSVKERSTKGDFIEELEELQTLHGLYDMQEALYSALRSTIYSDLGPDEKIAAGETIVTQFGEAFSAFFPSYIDLLAEMYGPMETWAAKQFELKTHLAKAGAEFSTANVTKIKSYCESLMGIHDGLTALVESKAGDTTLLSKAAEPQPEPVDDHSAALLAEIEAILATT